MSPGAESRQSISGFPSIIPVMSDPLSLRERNISLSSLEQINYRPFEISNDDLELRRILKPYSLYAECKAIFGKKELQCTWEKVTQILKAKQILISTYLSVNHLLELARQGDSGDQFPIVDYLKRLAVHRNLENVAKEYFEWWSFR